MTRPTDPPAGARSTVIMSSTATMTERRGRKSTVVAEGSETDEVEIDAPPTIHAEVGVSLGATVGLPNFSAARFDVTLRIPCKPDVKSVERAYAAALGFVQDKLETLKKAVE